MKDYKKPIICIEKNDETRNILTTSGELTKDNDVKDKQWVLQNT